MAEPAGATVAAAAHGTRRRRGRRALRAWDAFWFGESSLVRLALFRIVMLVAAFDGVWNVRPGVLQHSVGGGAGYLRRDWNPIYAFELLGLRPPGELVHAVWVVLVAAIVLGIVGLFTRAACAVVAVLGFYWIGCEYSFGKPHHTCIALVLGLFALPMAPVGARLSLDALLSRRRARAAPPPERAPWAALPLRVTQVTIATGYFFAGATKLAVSGLAWANGYTLMGVMVENRSAWSDELAANQPLLVLMSAGLLFGQLLFPLVFVATPLRWVFVPLMLLFHYMAMQTMATGPFLTLALALSAFVALERVPSFLGRVTTTGPAWRRVLAATTAAVLAWQIIAIYCGNKPVWFPWLFLPAAVALLAATLRRARERTWSAAPVGAHR